MKIRPGIRAVELPSEPVLAEEKPVLARYLSGGGGLVVGAEPVAGTDGATGNGVGYVRGRRRRRAHNIR